MMRKEVKTNKTTASLVGPLFLLATVTYFTGNGFLDSILTRPDYLRQVYPNRGQVTIGALLEFADTDMAHRQRIQCRGVEVQFVQNRTEAATSECAERLT